MAGLAGAHHLKDQIRRFHPPADHRDIDPDRLGEAFARAADGHLGRRLADAADHERLQTAEHRIRHTVDQHRAETGGYQLHQLLHGGYLQHIHKAQDIVPDMPHQLFRRIVPFNLRHRQDHRIRHHMPVDHAFYAHQCRFMSGNIHPPDHQIRADPELLPQINEVIHQHAGNRRRLLRRCGRRRVPRGGKQLPYFRKHLHPPPFRRMAAA